VSTPLDPYRPPAAAPLDGPAADAISPPTLDGVIVIMRQTRRWVRLMVGTLLVGALFSLVGAAFVVGASPAVSASLGLGFQAVILILFYAPSIGLLSRYAAGIRRLQQGGGMAALEDALASQKSYWKYIAVLTTVLLPMGTVGGYLIGRLMRH
jgi:hypothetical protein